MNQITLDKFLKEFNQKLDSKFEDKKDKTCWNNLSPLRFIGGKSFLSKWIYSFFPDHRNYIECFGGGASLLFFKEESLTEVYNDIDSNLTNFFRQLRDNPKELFRRLYFLPYSRAEFNRMKMNLSQRKYKDEIERAVIYFYLNRSSYGGRMKGVTFGYNLTGQTETGRIKKNTSVSKSYVYEIDHIFNYRNRIKNVIIENLDYKEIFNRYDSKHSLFYVDPPYFNINFYDYNFESQNHVELAEILSSIEGKFILSYNSHEKLEEFYPKKRFFWQQREFQNFMNNSNRIMDSSRKEILIMNFNIKKERKFTSKNQSSISKYFQK